MEELPTPKVSLHDPFWDTRLGVNSRTAIFHQWEQLEASGCIDNFRIAAGELDGFQQGWYFADSDAYKWLDAASRIQATLPDPSLAEMIDAFVDLLSRAQHPDGYLFTYNQIHFPGSRWTNLMIEHELYCHGHLIEAGVSHAQATNSSSLIQIARMAADRVTADFLGKGPAHTSGHEEIEIALLRLYQVTHHAPYCHLARQLLEQRGQMPQPLFAISLARQLRSVAARRSSVQDQRREYLALHPGYTLKKLPPGNFAKSAPTSRLRWLFSSLSGKYLQQHAPIRKQTVPVGHAVRFGYLQTATAMLHRLEGDATLLPALETAWEHMVSRRMYITGGIGSVPGLEGFGNDYELDPKVAYAETCAALASLFWSWEMALATGEAKYSDLFEWQLYNAAAAGIGLDGRGYLYNNPLVCTGGVSRKAWYAVPCCPSNLSRTWADLGKYIYSAGRDGLWVHQYIGSTASLQPGVPLDIKTESGLPWSGKVRIKIGLSSPGELTIHLRLPSWAELSASTLKFNGESLATQNMPLQQRASLAERTVWGYDPHQSSFLPVKRLWSAGDVLELDFDMPVTLRHAHPRVRGQRNQVAVTRGPLVYCLESTDNPDVDIFKCHLDTSSLEPEPAPGLLGNITILRARTLNGQRLVFIPYHLWANRGESRMTVWVNH